MPSNFTEHYQLSQWEAGDQVKREDFNADNAKIDAALGELQAGQLRLVTGSYVGTGEHGGDHPNTLTFPFPPKVVGIVAGTTKMDLAGTIFVRGQQASSGLGFTLNQPMSIGVRWEGNGVSWSTSNGNAVYQLNRSSTTYFYFAIG